MPLSYPALFYDGAGFFCPLTLRDQKGRVFSKTIENPRHVAQFLMPTIQQLCAEANIPFQNIRTIFTTQGPGSFTGIRIGLAAAQGFSSDTMQAYAINRLDFYGRFAMDSGQHDQGLMLIDGGKNAYFSAYYAKNSAPVYALLPYDDLVSYAQQIHAQYMCGGTTGVSSLPVFILAETTQAETVIATSSITVTRIKWDPIICWQMIAAQAPASAAQWQKNLTIPFYLKPPDVTRKPQAALVS